MKRGNEGRNEDAEVGEGPLEPPIWLATETPDMQPAETIVDVAYLSPRGLVSVS